MSGPAEPTLRSLLEAQVIPNEGLEDKCLDTKLSELSGDDISNILDHVNILYTPSPSIRIHILPFLSHLFLAHPAHSSLFPASSFFPTLALSLLLDQSSRILEQGLRLLNIVLPGSIVPSSAKLGDLLALLGKAAMFMSSQTTVRGKKDAFFASPSASEQMRRRRSSSGAGNSGVGVGAGLLSPLRGMKELPIVDDETSAHPARGQESVLGLGLGSGSGITGEGAGNSSTHNDNDNENHKPKNDGIMTGRSIDTVSAMSENSNEDKLMGLSLSPPSFMGMHHHHSHHPMNRSSLQPAPGVGWKPYHDPVGGLYGVDEAQEVFELYHHYHHYQSRQTGLHHAGHSRTRSAGNPTSPSATSSSVPANQGHPYSASTSTSTSILAEYLSLLYTVFPLNLVRFINDPAGYLGEKGIACPFALSGGWKDVWKEGEMARLTSPYMKSFLFNPALLTGTAKTELDGVANRFSKMEADEIVGLAGSLLAILPAPGLVDTEHETSTEKTQADQQRPQLPPRSMTELTDNTSTSMSISMTPGGSPGRSMKTVRHRRSSELAIPVTGTNPLTAMSISIAGPSRTGVNAYAPVPAHPIAIRPTGGLGVGLGAGNEGETERLRKQVEVLTLDLAHQKKLAGMYLQHVNRLYQSAVSARSGEAEQQNLYNHIKDQERLAEQKNRELQSVKDELARTRKSSSEEKARLSAKMAENRDLKKQVSQKQGARNDEILDRESLITHLKTELIKEKEKSFKLDNRLREAEPKIKKIGDYEQQIDKFEENQLLWDDDLKKLQDYKDAIDKMTSAFVQMQHHTKAMQDEHDQLVDQVRSLKGELEDAKIDHDILRKKNGSSEAQDGEGTMSGKPSFLLNEIETLRQKVEASQIRVHDLEQELLEANADQEELEFLRKVRAQGKSSMLA